MVTIVRTTGLSMPEHQVGGALILPILCIYTTSFQPVSCNLTTLLLWALTPVLGNRLVCRTHGLWSLLLSNCKKGRCTKARSCRSVLQCAPINARSCNQQFTFVDSKTLSEEQREKLFGGISTASDLLGWKTEILSPNDISNAMLQRLLILEP